MPYSTMHGPPHDCNNLLQLLAHTIAVAKALGTTKLTLATNRKQPNAIHLYGSLGCFAAQEEFNRNLIEGKRGCIVVGSVAELATLDADVALRVTASLHKSESLMAELIQQGQSDGSIPAALDSATTARLMLCLLQGMRVVGKTGRSRKEMTVVADAAMKLLV